MVDKVGVEIESSMAEIHATASSMSLEEAIEFYDEISVNCKIAADAAQDALFMGSSDE